ncbi:DUF3152 domain-containing protein [Candidatus Saccharibacteria bacterium]|nr:DUF3152 domain-containing protein [Candidatus Saccharibacteria bacterium]
MKFNRKLKTGEGKMKKKLLIGAVCLVLVLAMGGVAWAVLNSDRGEWRVITGDYEENSSGSNSSLSDDAEDVRGGGENGSGVIDQPESPNNEESTGVGNEATVPGMRRFSYCVETRGSVASDFGEFRIILDETLRDERGWRRAGADFVQVESGCDFIFVLSEARLLPEFSLGCSVDWSCRVGDWVIFNEMRWREGVAAWLGMGGNMLDYRRMVINHEVGHWLGWFDNEHVCQGAGLPAPLMQQQSMDLRGCVPNPWPLEIELEIRR